ncbi:MAG TPA: transposase [Pirellulaceae bacterium]|nr:transposase [Pirellulaceae bacterium]HMO92359.1 transposase [Pirellulaceae bacterium]
MKADTNADPHFPYNMRPNFSPILTSVKPSSKASDIVRLRKIRAIDSTGSQSRHCSSYYVKRRSREQNLWQTTTDTLFPKVGIVCDVSNHLILEAQASRGPCPDVADFKTPLERAARQVRIRDIVADAGYDRESNHHAFARDKLKIQSINPANAWDDKTSEILPPFFSVS